MREQPGSRPPLDVLARRADGAVILNDGTIVSPREAEILGLISEGLRNREIAERLYLSVHTVEYHVTRLLQKLRVENRTEAAALAVAWGWRELAAAGPATPHDVPSAGARLSERRGIRRFRAAVAGAVVVSAVLAAAAWLVLPSGRDGAGVRQSRALGVSSTGSVSPPARIVLSGHPECARYVLEPDAGGDGTAGGPSLYRGRCQAE